MHPEVGVLRELIVLAGVSLAVVLLFQRLRLPALVGFIATGVLIGPGGLGLVGDPALVQTLAEIGVVVLLFTVGLEFSLADLRAMGRRTVVAGAPVSSVIRNTTPLPVQANTAAVDIDVLLLDA